MEKTFELPAEADTIALGQRLGQNAPDGAVLVLTGDLGAGKTRLTKGIAAGLGISDDITSPTFNLVYEYEGGRLPLHHFDLYRLEEPEQLDDIAYWEIVESGGVSVIEWGDRFPDEIPADHLLVDFSVSADGVRTARMEAVGPLSEALLAGLE